MPIVDCDISVDDVSIDEVSIEGEENDGVNSPISVGEYSEMEGDAGVG